MHGIHDWLFLGWGGLCVKDGLQVVLFLVEYFKLYIVLVSGLHSIYELTVFRQIRARPQISNLTLQVHDYAFSIVKTSL